MDDERYLRIGELSRRSGVSVDLLRAWERRYGLLEPARSDGGFRLYSDDDVERVRTMQAHLGEGLAAAEAARRALAREPETAGPVPSGAVEQARQELTEALASFAEARAHSAFDRVLGALTLDTVLADVVLPYLHELGESWARGETTIAQEHFASNIIRGRLLGLARGWGPGSGRTRCSPARRGSSTTSGCSRSASPSAAAAGASPTSGRTRRSRPSRSMRARWTPT